MPDLRQLRAFVTVAEELNFTRAAERLFMGQQGVSKAVRQLERELGVALLERTTREVRLTAAGAALLRDGRDALAAADAAFERARSVGRGTAGTVTVGVSPAVGPGVRDEVVRALRADAHELSVSLREVRPAQVAPSLRDREVDLVLARTAPDVPDVDSAALSPTPTVLYVPAGHRLAGAERVTLGDLDGERLLTWNPPGTPFTDLLVSRLSAAGATVEPVQARVMGMAAFTDLADLDAVALMPSGWPQGDDTVAIALAEQVTLPLLVLWLAGAPPTAVGRIRAAMSASA